VIEKRQGLKIGCIEEIAFRMGFISKDDLEKLAVQYIKSGYGLYIQNIVDKENKMLTEKRNI
jgi:glucose-1-phosphate thymidylyltransferase